MRALRCLTNPREDTEKPDPCWRVTAPIDMSLAKGRYWDRFGEEAKKPGIVKSLLRELGDLVRWVIITPSPEPGFINIIAGVQEGAPNTLYEDFCMVVKSHCRIDGWRFVNE